jgi:F-type H+-transporting ATPase subunit alpha
LLRDVPIEKVAEFESDFLNNLELNHKEDVLNVLKVGVINPEIEAKLREVASAVSKQYKK